MRYKYDRLQLELEKVDGRVRNILVAMCRRRLALNLPDVMVTSIYREDGVHHQWRAGDAGVNGLTEEQATAERDWVNETFPSVDKFQTCVLHIVPGSKDPALHQHIQVGVNPADGVERPSGEKAQTSEA